MRQVNLRALPRGKLVAGGAALVAILAGVAFAFPRAGGRLSSADSEHRDVAGSLLSPSDRPTGSAHAQLAPSLASPSARSSTAARSVMPALSPPGNRQNCANRPSACGYPDETNTGWRHTGIRLTKVVVDTYTIDKPGATVDGLDIRGCVDVRAKNVTIKRSKITCSRQPMIKNFEPDGRGGLIDIGAGLVVEDVELDGLNDPDAQGMAFNSYTIRRAHFHNLGAAVKLGSGVRIEDSYVADIASTESSHNGGFPSDGGDGITIRHNTVLMNSQNGYAIAIYNQIPAGSTVQNVVIDNNLLAGGNYVLYCGAPGKIAPNLRVTNNRFSNRLYANGGFYGPTANCDGGAAWSNNYWDDTGALLMP